MSDTRNLIAAASTPSGRDANPSRFKPAWWLGIAGLAFLFVLLRWNNFSAPLTRDEGEYAYAAQLLLHGQLPYEQSYLQKPPMVAYTYALAALVAPDVFWSPRILAALCAGIATILLGDIARREFGPGVAMTALWLLTPMLLMPALSQFIANTEMFMLLPLMATAAIYVRCRHAQGGGSHWLAAGAFAAITLLYKYTSLPMLAWIFAAWSREEWRREKNPRALAGRWLAALTGGTIAAVMVLAPFLLRDGGRRLWECTVVFNRYYAVSSGFGWKGFRSMPGQFWHYWWFLLVAPLFLLYRRERRTGFWFLFFLAAWLGTAGSTYWHYFLPVAPAWALLTAVAIRSFSGWISTQTALPKNPVRRLLAGIMVLLVCRPDAAKLVLSPRDFAVRELGGYGTFLGVPLVAARLAELAPAEDLIYVAGSEPEIYCYAHRFGCTRFDIAYPLMIPTPLARGCQAEAIRDLERHPPAAVVLARSASSWLRQPGTPPDFLDFLQKLIREKYEVVGGCLDDGKQVRWQEPLAPEDAAGCAMILFKRKNR